MKRYLRTVGRALLITTVLYPTSLLAVSESLPYGFGGAYVGQPWASVPLTMQSTSLTNEQAADQACGFAWLQGEHNGARIQIEIRDNVVARMSWVKELKKGTNLVAAMNALIQRYGQPVKQEARDVLGNLTSDAGEIRHVAMNFDAPNPVLVTLSGEQVWKQQVVVSHAQFRLLDNRTRSCQRRAGKSRG